jgi:hypothetical protein
MTSSVRITVLLVSIFSRTVAAQQPTTTTPIPPTLRSIDVFGTSVLTGDDVATEFKSDIDSIAAAFGTWPPNVELAGPATERIETALKSRGSFAYVHVGVTYSPAPDNGFYFMVDVVEKKDAGRRMPFRKQPTGVLADPDGLIAKWDEYQNKVFQLIFSGTSLQVNGCPVLHCLAPFSLPELAPYLSVFNDGAKTHEKELYKIVSSDRDGKHRAAALFLLAHTNNAKKLLPVLGRAIHDPDEGVRNNTMRIMMQMAASDPNLDYPIKELIAALEFPSPNDRNKSAYVLSILVKSPRYRAAIARHAVPSLLKLLRLRQANNHDPAYETLKTLSGKTFGDRDYNAWESWGGRSLPLNRRCSCNAPDLDALEVVRILGRSLTSNAEGFTDPISTPEKSKITGQLCESYL